MCRGFGIAKILCVDVHGERKSESAFAAIRAANEASSVYANELHVQRIGYRIGCSQQRKKECKDERSGAEFHDAETSITGWGEFPVLNGGNVSAW